MKIKINKIKWIKKHYLFSFSLWIPPLHELGHVFICKIMGIKVLSVHFDYMTHEYTSFNFPNLAWDIITVCIPVVFFLLFIIKSKPQE